MSGDRTVHGLMKDGSAIVRYDRAGKWFIEGYDQRAPITIGEAVELATERGAQVFLGRPGGKSFDARVRRAQEGAGDGA